MLFLIAGVTLAIAGVTLAALAPGQPQVERKASLAPDGVEIDEPRRGGRRGAGSWLTDDWKIR
jgi:hypothetical protein